MLTILPGDSLEVLKTLEADSVQCCVTSPPYYQQRDYGVDGQIGLEETPEQFIDALVDVFREVRRVLKPDGTAWVNLGDSYASGGKGGGGSFMAERKDGSWAGQSKASGWRSAPEGYKHKDLIGAPWMLAFALRADGWYLRSDIIWHKPNPMPEGATDRPTKSHEYIFLLSKSSRYFYDNDAIRELTGNESDPAVYAAAKGQSFHDHSNDAEAGMQQKKHANFKSLTNPLGRNKRTVWSVAAEQCDVAHFATFPKKLIEPCILAGSRKDDVILDPFSGAGTTGLVAARLGRSYIGIELNPEYVEISRKRIEADMPLFNQVKVG